METQNNQEAKLCKHCQTKIPKKAKVCPNCKKKQGGITKWIVIAVVAIVIVGAVAGGGDDDTQESLNSSTNTTQHQENNESGEKQEKESTEEIVYTSYTVTQMMEELRSNAIKAESTYKNQRVEITGRLGVIDSSGKYISLYPEDDEFALVGVQCHIKSEEQKQKVMEISVGDIVTLKGKVKSVGEVIGYSLDIDEIN